MRLFRTRKRASLFSRVLPHLDRWMTPMGSRFQRWAAPRLTRIERQLSRRQKIAAITVFCLITAGYSMALLLKGLSNSSHSPDYLSPPSITRPLPLPRRDTIPFRQHLPTLTDSLSIIHP